MQPVYNMQAIWIYKQAGSNRRDPDHFGVVNAIIFLRNKSFKNNYILKELFYKNTWFKIIYFVIGNMVI